MKVLEEIIPLQLLEKVARIREIGAGEELIDLCLRKAEWPISFPEIINQLATDSFRQVYMHLEGNVQRQIEVLISPPTLLNGSPRKQRRESEIWQAREQIHKLKTEPINSGKTRTRRTWKQVTEALHAQGLLVNKTQEQIYWTLKDKRENPKLSPEDKKLLEEMFGRTERGKIKQQVEEMADAIELARLRLSWEETHKTLQDFFGWTGTLQQLTGAYARIRIERQKRQASEQPRQIAEPAKNKEAATKTGA